MNVNIGIGYDKILFGMKQNEIIDILETPDKVINVREDGIEFIYNSIKVKLFFDYEENERLYSIEVFDENATFMSKKIINMSVSDFLSFMLENGYSFYETVNYDYFETYYYDDINTTFTVEFGKIRSFEFSPLFEKDNNTIIWP